jgi:membrane-associated protein
MGKASKRKSKEQVEATKLRHLLLAMIHINSLAFFMFAQGSQQKPMKVVLLAGLLNLPYYLLLIAGTAILSEQVMAMAENVYMLVSVISIWLIVALVYDIRNHKKQDAQFKEMLDKREAKLRKTI